MTPFRRRFRGTSRSLRGHRLRRTLCDRSCRNRSVALARHWRRRRGSRRAPASTPSESCGRGTSRRSTPRAVPRPRCGRSCGSGRGEPARRWRRGRTGWPGSCTRGTARSWRGPARWEPPCERRRRSRRGGPASSSRSSVRCAETPRRRSERSSAKQKTFRDRCRRAWNRVSQRIASSPRSARRWMKRTSSSRTTPRSTSS
mmetsp:Transcript_31178/g.98081  ORF Transcript_31178/g.98081 Transcript_31178/m.98081 type:complete len:201 (+) Transcript_31178:165-767(+)